MGLLQALKTRKPTTRAVIAKNKAVWWAQSVKAAICGQRGPGEKIGTLILGQAGEDVEALAQKLATETRGHKLAEDEIAQIGRASGRERV